jgi:hypothetical protein
MMKKYDIGFLGGNESDDKVMVEMTRDEYEEYKEIMEHLEPLRDEDGRLPEFRTGGEMGGQEGRNNDEDNQRSEFQELSALVSSIAFTNVTCIQAPAILFRLDSFVAPLCGLINSLL